MRAIRPLNLLTPGETSTVTQLAGGCQLIGRLAALGLSPGSAVTMVRNTQHGPLIVMIRKTRIALGRGEARFVLVEDAAPQAAAVDGSDIET
jgi:ferrous iron transport protein A